MPSDIIKLTFFFNKKFHILKMILLNIQYGSWAAGTNLCKENQKIKMDVDRPVLQGPIM